MTILNTNDDFEWLKDVHNVFVGEHEGDLLYGNEHEIAILHGSEDSPDKVELYAKNHYQCKPTVYTPDYHGNLVILH